MSVAEPGCRAMSRTREGSSSMSAAARGDKMQFWTGTAFETVTGLKTGTSSETVTETGAGSEDVTRTDPTGIDIVSGMDLDLVSGMDLLRALLQQST